MSAFSDYLEVGLLNFLLRGVAFVPPGTLYVSLHTAAGANESTSAWLATELTGAATGYVRMPVTTASWTAPVLGAGSSSTNVSVSWPAAGSAWGIVTHFALWDVSPIGTGNLWFPFTLPNARTIANGDVATLTAGNVTVTLA